LVLYKRERSKRKLTGLLRGVIIMKRACFFLKVKKGLLEEYKNAHKEVWPEMLEAIRRAGMKNYSLFLLLTQRWFAGRLL